VTFLIARQVFLFVTQLHQPSIVGSANCVSKASHRILTLPHQCKLPIINLAQCTVADQPHLEGSCGLCYL
jgi:hypothetical protein